MLRFQSNILLWIFNFHKYQPLASQASSSKMTIDIDEIQSLRCFQYKFPGNPKGEARQQSYPGPIWIRPSTLREEPPGADRCSAVSSDDTLVHRLVQAFGPAGEVEWQRDKFGLEKEATYVLRHQTTTCQEDENPKGISAPPTFQIQAKIMFTWAPSRNGYTTRASNARPNHDKIRHSLEFLSSANFTTKSGRKRGMGR